MRPLQAEIKALTHAHEVIRAFVDEAKPGAVVPRKQLTKLQLAFDEIAGASRKLVAGKVVDRYDSPRDYAIGEATAGVDVLHAYRVTAAPDAAFADALKALSVLSSKTASLLELSRGKQAELVAAAGRPAAAPYAPVPALDALGTDMTTLAAAGSLRRPSGRPEVLGKIGEVLGRPGPALNSVVITADPGSGKTELLSALAHGIVDGSVPGLAGKRLLVVKAGSFLSEGDGVIGDLEKKVASITAAAKEHDAVVVIDEAHQLAGLGVYKGNANDVLQQFLDEWGKGGMPTVLVTTTQHAGRLLADGAVERRFEPVVLGAPTRADVVDALRVRAAEHAGAGVQISDVALQRLAGASFAGAASASPGAQVAVLDRVASHVSSIRSAGPLELHVLREERLRAGRALSAAAAAGDLDAASRAATLQRTTGQAADKLEARWRDEVASLDRLDAARAARSAAVLDHATRSPDADEPSLRAAAEEAAVDVDTALVAHRALLVGRPALVPDGVGDTAFDAELSRTPSTGGTGVYL